MTLDEYLHIIRAIEYINAENGISRAIIAAREKRSPAESLFTVRDGLNLRPGAGVLNLVGISGQAVIVIKWSI